MSHTTATHRITTLRTRRKTVGAATAVLATLALMACGGGGGGASSVNPATLPIAVEPPAPPSAVTLPASEPGALLSYVRKKLNVQIDKGLAGNGEGAFSFAGTQLPTVALPASVVVSSGAPAPAPSYASTTLQEGGVDEPDILKTDGNRLFSMTVAKPATNACPTSGFTRAKVMAVCKRAAASCYPTLTCLKACIWPATASSWP